MRTTHLPPLHPRLFLDSNCWQALSGRLCCAQSPAADSGIDPDFRRPATGRRPAARPVWSAEWWLAVWSGSWCPNFCWSSHFGFGSRPWKRIFPLVFSMRWPNLDCPWRPASVEKVFDYFSISSMLDSIWSLQIFCDEKTWVTHTDAVDDLGGGALGSALLGVTVLLVWEGAVAVFTSGFGFCRGGELFSINLTSISQHSKQLTFLSLTVFNCSLASRSASNLAVFDCSPNLDFTLLLTFSDVLLPVALFADDRLTFLASICLRSPVGLAPGLPIRFFTLAAGWPRANGALLAVFVGLFRPFAACFGFVFILHSRWMMCTLSRPGGDESCATSFNTQIRKPLRLSEVMLKTFKAICFCSAKLVERGRQSLQIVWVFFWNHKQQMKFVWKKALLAPLSVQSFLVWMCGLIDFESDLRRCMRRLRSMATSTQERSEYIHGILKFQLNLFN